MSGPSTAEVAATPVPEGAAAVWDKRPVVEALLQDIFRLMDYPVRLDFKDLSDGSLGVAVHVEGEQPGITPGKKSFLIDSVQFLVNKVVNRPNAPRRWVNLAVNAFPEPRPERGAAPVATPAPSAPVREARPERAPAKAHDKPAAKAHDKPAEKPHDKPHDKPAERGAEKRAPERGRDEARDARRGGGGSDESSLQVAADPTWTALAQSLADKSAKLGRPYGLMLLSNEDRARVVQAAAGVKGVSVRAEGEGIWRRVAFKPDKLTAMTKRSAMPDYDDEDE